MKIEVVLHVCHKFLHKNNGYDLAIREWVDGINKKQFVICFFFEEEIENYIKKNDLVKREGTYYSNKYKCSIIPFFYKKRSKKLVNNFWNLSNIMCFNKFYKQLLASIKPSEIHIHGTLLPFFLIAAKISKKSKIKVITTHHLGYVNELFREWLLHNFMTLYSDKILAVSDHGKKSFIFKGKVEVSNLLNYSRDYKKNQSKKGALKNIFKDDKSLYYFCPARICYQKNQYRLVKAFLRHLKTNPSSKLILCGEIYDYNFYKKMNKLIRKSKFKDNFYVFGPLEYSDIIEIYSIINYVVFPSINEGLGRVVLESIEKNIPVLCSNDGGSKELINDGENGLLINPHSVNSIRKGLIKIQSLSKISK